MNSKPSRILRFMAPVFALTLLSAYVVYSQRTHARTIAPGSKSMALPGPSSIDATTGIGETNTSEVVSAMNNVTGFQRPGAAGLNLNQPMSQKQVEDLMMASGSKSGPVFDFRITPPSSLAGQPKSASQTFVETNRVARLKH
jgi:hypothetical protein